MQPSSGALRVGVAVVAIGLCAGQAQARDSVRVAVLPMVVHSVQDHDYLRDGLSEMLAARLARDGVVAVVRVDDPARATTRIEAAREVARGLGADYALFGSFTRFGEGASLDVRCVSASGQDARDPRSIFIQSGNLGQIIPRIDGLADSVVRHVTNAAPAAGPPIGSGSFAGPTTESELRDALSELELLRDRLQRLEETVYGGDEEVVSEAAPEPEAPGPALSAVGESAAPLP